MIKKLIEKIHCCLLSEEFVTINEFLKCWVIAQTINRYIPHLYVNEWYKKWYHGTVTRFGPKVGQIGPKMYWIWSEKFTANLTHFGSESGDCVSWLCTVVCCYWFDTGMVGLASKWVRFAPNGTNSGLFQIRFQYIWLR